MSVSYSVYIGPYIQVYNPKKERKETIRCCPEPACGNHGILHTSSSYCSICGTKIIDCQVPAYKCLDFDCYDQTNDRLFEIMPEYRPEGMKDYVFLGPNVGKIGRSFQAYDTRIESVTELTIRIEIEEMKQKFRPEIEHIKEVFGKDAVEVRWGVIAYAS